MPLDLLETVAQARKIKAALDQAEAGTIIEPLHSELKAGLDMIAAHFGVAAAVIVPDDGRNKPPASS